ncbi:ATP-binding protein [Motiliproteus sediminis]|uniref:ATP-binding protein n=1 Tax=Motiliproteus sediminis TaxID=1468178 RepID=UPI001AEFD7A5|nr:ATP-binding protein [Motiliproteus sediminis]
MEKDEEYAAVPRRLSRFTWQLMFYWSIAILASFLWNYSLSLEQAEALARTNARTAVEKDILYRRWVAGLGGVYARVSEQLRPNPYLELLGIADAQITTDRGVELALVNPAYMTRQVHELGRDSSPLKGHLTSLRPIRPENGPDPWEALALQRFAHGEREFGEVVMMERQPFYRYMQALEVTKACLRCHEHQGYQLGDVRGGLSVTFPLADIEEITTATLNKISSAHLAIWLLGIGFIGWGRRQLVRQERDLLGANDTLRAEVARRINAETLLTRERDDQQALAERLKSAQSQLVQSEKLAVIGQLAAGIAHEINNPTGYVLSNLKSLSRYFAQLEQMLECYAHAEKGLPESVRDQVIALKQHLDLQFLRQDCDALISESQEGMGRIKKIVADLKDFSRSNPEQAQWQYEDLHSGLDSTLNLVANELKYKAEVVRDYTELPRVECDMGKLNQVFMNLLVNAGQAITEKGVITVSTRILAPGWVEVAVCDSGEGISRDRVERVFDPFYTTKPVGKGTGLGLSIAKSIIDAHHGVIDVESEPGCGTCFRIKLPVVHTGDGTD